MSQSISMIGMIVLALLLFWIIGAATDQVFYHQDSLDHHLFHPNPYEILIRLSGGFALAVALVLLRFNQIRNRDIQRNVTLQQSVFENLVNNSPDCLLVQENWRLVFANSNALDFLEAQDFDLLAGSSFLDYVLPDHHQKVLGIFEELMDGKEHGPVEITMALPSGKIRNVTAAPAKFIWFGKIAQVIFFRDITNEIETHRSLAAGKERLQLALDAARDGVWDWDIPTSKMVYNDSWASMLGYSLDEISHTLETWRQFIHPDDYDRAQTLIESHMNGVIPSYEIEVRLRHKNGQYIWVLDRGKVVERDSQGNPLRMAGTHRNITQRKEAELALEVRNRVAEAFLTGESEGIFSRIMEVVCSSISVPCGFFTIIDPFAKVQVLGTWPPDKEMQEALNSYAKFEPGQLPVMFDTVINQNRYFLDNQPDDLSRNPFPLESILGVPISNRQEVLGAIYTCSKVGGFQKTDQIFLESLAGYIAPILQAYLNTEAKETQLRQAQKMEALGALAGGIAHDFNNILQAIMGFTSLALEDAGSDGNLPGDLKRVLKATHRGQELVQRILLFSRRDEQIHMPVDIQSVAMEAINLLKTSIPATIEIRPNLEAEKALVFGDPGQISQIILNLATNAFHAMESDGGVLDVGLHILPPTQSDCPESLKGKEIVLLSVSDTGIGMDEQIKDRLFDPFFTTKEVGKGTGLGLSVVHGIVKAHQGEIRVNSELEIGTNVMVFLPLFKSDIFEESVSDENEALVIPGNPHIVLIDDEEDITDLGKTLLERLGCRVTTKSNGRHLLDLLEKDPEFCDLVITDLTMPQITGFQLADRINKIAPGLPIILITGISEQEKIDLGPHSNIRGLIRKPFGRDTLRLKVSQILGQQLDQKEF